MRTETFDILVFFSNKKKSIFFISTGPQVSGTANRFVCTRVHHIQNCEFILEDKRDSPKKNFGPNSAIEVSKNLE